MKKLTVLSLSLSFIWFFFYADQGACKESGLPIKITGLGRRVGSGMPQTRGLLSLRFINDKARPVSVHFLGILRGGMCREELDIKHKFLPYYGDVRGGAVATVKYSWTTKAGKAILTKQYDSTENAMNISAGSYNTLFIPIQLPNKPGSYNLHVEFDNRNIEDAARTNGDYDSTSIYFRSETEETIRLP